MKQFGKYQITEALAHGGMAEVYLATVHGEAGFAKPVVIKRLHSHLSRDEELVRMLIDEARITAQLNQSNICQVLDLGLVDGNYFIALEYVAGADLAALNQSFWAERRRLPDAAALHISCEVLSGLHYAHTRHGTDGEPLNIVHRDVSPQNILVSYEGDVKLTDFGIAKARKRLVATESGVVKGKFRYMAPEQSAGGPIDPRTDVFAAGLVLYEMLRGEPHLWDLPDAEVVLRMRDVALEPLGALRPDLPPALVDVVTRAMARDSRERFSDAASFRRALLPFLGNVSTAFGRSDLAALMAERFAVRRERAGVARPMAHDPTLRDDADLISTAGPRVELSADSSLHRADTAQAPSGRSIAWIGLAALFATLLALAAFFGYRLKAADDQRARDAAVASQRGRSSIAGASTRAALSTSTSAPPVDARVNARGAADPHERRNLRLRRQPIRRRVPPLPTAEPTGLLRVNSWRPFRLYIDGYLRGFGRSMELRISAGSYRLRIYWPHAKRGNRERVIEIKPGGRRSIHFASPP
ncbi:MAG: serine/threonine protein kinase [Deltaproteobacteria bacterium]|nr:serine/threonine protein kinase [Deltaproteobacteria bacterium]